MNEGISAVICCFNGAKRISTVLDYLLKQQFENEIDWEVILVDNASEDNTVEIARNTWNSKTVPLHIVSEPKKGLSNARAAGIRESHFDLVCFIDDDNWVNPVYIERSFRIMQNNPGVALVGGQGEAVLEGEEPGWFHQFRHAYAVGPQAPTDGIMNGRLNFLYGAGLTLRKDVWNTIVDKGFTFYLSDRKGTSITSGGDAEMCYAVRLAGYDLYYDSKLTFKHFMPAGRITIPYLLKLAASFGKATAIADVYDSMLMNSKGFERAKIHNYPLFLLRACYSLMLVLPGYLKHRILKDNSITPEFEYISRLENLKHILCHHREHKKLLEELKNAAWFNLRERIQIS